MRPSRTLGNVTSKCCAEAELARDGGDAFGAGAQRGLVEVDVARVLDGAVQIDAAVAAALPAMEGAPAVTRSRPGS